MPFVCFYLMSMLEVCSRVEMEKKCNKYSA